MVTVVHEILNKVDLSSEERVSKYKRSTHIGIRRLTYSIAGAIERDSFSSRNSITEAKSIDMINTKIFDKDCDKREDIILAETVWEILKEFTKSMPFPLKVIINTAGEVLSKWNNKGKRELRLFLEFILIENFLYPVLRNPLQYGLIDDCELPSMYYKYAEDICKILRMLICGKKFLPHEPLSAYANSMIIELQ